MFKQLFSDYGLSGLCSWVGGNWTMAEAAAVVAAAVAAAAEAEAEAEAAAAVAANDLMVVESDDGSDIESDGSYVPNQAMDHGVLNPADHQSDQGMDLSGSDETDPGSERHSERTDDSSEGFWHEGLWGDA
jgi:hypothetical protein